MDGVEKGPIAAYYRASPRLLWWALIANALFWLGVGNAVVWGPLWLHWRVNPPKVAPAVIEAHRSTPADSVLADVAEMSMTTDHPLRGEAAVTAAGHLLHGELVLPHLPRLPIDPAFAPGDLLQGVPSQQVFLSSLIVPDLLLRAHEHAPDPAYVAAALRYARGFFRYEANVQMPRAYERNSHATSNRVSVLARLWQHVRQAPDYEPDTGRIIHLHAQRLGALLAKPSTFIASTNHGVMQNIGLLQLSTSFPALPDAAAWRELALKRLGMQLDGWISPEGAALEHSAGYHFHAVVLTGYVVKLLEMSGDPALPTWIRAHRSALAFMQTLQRPDRSLPPYGNTFRYEWQLPPVLQMDDEAWDMQLRDRDTFSRTFPVAGHSVWWDAHSAAGTATHTHVPWGYFAGHGHRRAQELSLMIWADGTDWSTNTGYWPGEDADGVAAADGWAGGSGPHVAGEAPQNDRHSTLLARHESENVRFLDLERISPPDGVAALRVRRQILQWGGSTWIVLDSHSDPNKRELRVLWTAAPETTQTRIGERNFLIERNGSTVAMELTVEGSKGVTATALRGSRKPFGGWVAYDRKAVPAPAVDARQPSSDSWMLTILHLRPSKQAAFRPALRATMTRYAGPENWTLRFNTSARDEALEIERVGLSLILRTQDPTTPVNTRTLALTQGERPDVALHGIARSRAALLAAYPRYQTNEWLRQRQSIALLVLWIASSIGLTITVLLWRHWYRTRTSRVG